MVSTSSIRQQDGAPKTSTVTEHKDPSRYDLSVQVLRLFCDTIAEERAEAHQQRKANFKSGGIGRKPAPPLTGISVFDGSVTHGVLASQYLKQVPRLRSITINEPTRRGTDVNAAHTTLVSTGDIQMEKVVCVNRDTRSLLSEHIEQNKTFDVVDLSQEDAGTYMYMDAAIQAVASDGGLLCFSSKDHATLHGLHKEACYARYGTVTLSNSVYRDELALRTLLSAIDTSAVRYKRYIVPWLSIWKNNSAMVYVRVYADAEHVQHALNRRIMLCQSTQCPTFHTQPVAMPSQSGSDSSKTCAFQHFAAVGAAASAETSLAPDSTTSTTILNTNAAVAHNATLPSLPLGAVTVHMLSGGKAIYQSGQWELPGDCEESGGAWRIAGPFWGGALHDSAILQRLMTRIRRCTREVNKANKLATAPSVGNADLNTVQSTVNNPGEVADSTNTATGSAKNKKTTKIGNRASVNAQPEATANDISIASAPQLLQLLGNLREELSVPFYYTLSTLAATLQCSPPPHLAFSSALTNAGYNVSTFHGDVHVIKTDAPASAVNKLCVYIVYVYGVRIMNTVSLYCCVTEAACHRVLNVLDW